MRRRIKKEDHHWADDGDINGDGDSDDGDGDDDGGDLDDGDYPQQTRAVCTILRVPWFTWKHQKTLQMPENIIKWKTSENIKQRCKHEKTLETSIP